jgi:hypothetical protein
VGSLRGGKCGVAVLSGSSFNAPSNLLLERKAADFFLEKLFLCGGSVGACLPELSLLSFAGELLGKAVYPGRLFGFESGPENCGRLAWSA